MSKLRKYARLIVKVGVNIQEGQVLVINSPVDTASFTRLLVEEAYLAGASKVIVRWSDDLINKAYFTYASLDVIKEIPSYAVEELKYVVSKNAAVISIAAPTPELLKEIDPAKLQAHALVTNEALSFYRAHMMSNGAQWCVSAYPTLAWAKKVFPALAEDEAQALLLDKIFEASRVRSDNDPIKEWHQHMDNLSKVNARLNQEQFLSLKFSNSLGTKLEVGLVEAHIWAGGGEVAKNGVFFAPNIPTEEAFTMPHKDKVNGRVVATKPLNYQGHLIEDFYLDFKDGKVVDYEAKVGKDALSNLLNLDEGSKHLGEVALISHDSPISKMNVLFYNTLFDENASCHLALGNAYTMNITDGSTLSEEELLKKGYNKSFNHVDFMFGSADLEVIGVKKDFSEVIIFKDGKFNF